MSGDVGADRAGGELGFDSQRVLSDQLGGVGSQDVDPEDFPVLPVYDDLHEPFGFTRDPRPPVGQELELAGGDVVALREGLLLRQAGGANLGDGVDPLGMPR
ncbi:MAG: hypothetical protein Q7O66_20315 [Dehalococcoidia bacterium]|nr:hypothetical protein [Dehalococcoidia bacterium]